MTMVRPMILDTTLRDGSYVINFQFSSSDTRIICSALQEAGLQMIEIGHGIGLGASESGKGTAAESDMVYMRAAAESLTIAKWGMFCIPGIAKLEHIDLAADYGMSFIRVGSDVDKVGASEAFIARAKKHEMFVCANFMKSYATDPEDFARKALLSARFGADMVYIVDSAGGMLTTEMEQYFQAVQAITQIRIGFHGHNNLGLAVANTLRAVELGAAIVDASLQGLGRSAGNTPTEVLLLALDRMGVQLGINPLQVMDIGEKYIRPLVQLRGYDPIDIVAGYSQFHSSYMGLIKEYSYKYNVDPRRLIIALCQEDKVNAPRELLEIIAKRIQGESEEVFTARFHLNRFHGAEQSNG